MVRIDPDGQRIVYFPDGTGAVLDSDGNQSDPWEWTANDALGPSIGYPIWVLEDAATPSKGSLQSAQFANLPKAGHAFRWGGPAVGGAVGTIADVSDGYPLDKALIANGGGAVAGAAVTAGVTAGASWLGGATGGAAMGSVVPGVGTAVGFLLGAATSIFVTKLTKGWARLVFGSREHPICRRYLSKKVLASEAGFLAASAAFLLGAWSAVPALDGVAGKVCLVLVLQFLPGMALAWMFAKSDESILGWPD